MTIDHQPQPLPVGLLPAGLAPGLLPGVPSGLPHGLPPGLEDIWAGEPAASSLVRPLGYFCAVGGPGNSPWVSPAVASEPAFAEPAYIAFGSCHGAAAGHSEAEVMAPFAGLQFSGAAVSGAFGTALESEDNPSGETVNVSDWDDCQAPSFKHQTGTWQCRWHDSAKSVGTVSQNGHVFTKTAGAQKIRKSSSGVTQALSSICMVFDKSLRKGGTHMYNYQILEGEVGAADGAGFVFDSRVRRNNIQRMRAVFLNQRGQICVRDHARVKKIGAELPPLHIGMSLNFSIDLDNLYCQFTVSAADGGVVGAADVGLSYCSEGIFDGDMSVLRSGFFCAVVTKDISVSLA